MTRSNVLHIACGMGQIICIGNPKGGVGKTTTALSLSSAFAIAEKKTLLVDLDPQGHATTGMGIDKKAIQYGLHQGLLGESTAKDLIMDSDIDTLKIIPALMDLFHTEAEISSKPGKECLLRDMLKDQRERFDFIVIDSPPSLNLLTINALTASDSLLIPLQCEFYAIESLGQLLRVYGMVKKNFNPHIKIEGILLTMSTEGEKVSIRIAENVKSRFHNMLFKTVIPRDSRISESTCYGKPLLLQDINSTGAQCYLNLAKEILNAKLAA